MYKRILTLDLAESETCFLWGPRQTGKSTLLRSLFPKAKKYDLLLSSEFRKLVQNPGLIREECKAENLDQTTQQQPIIIDEVQKIPELLDEVHWLIENKGLRFILCGSSARKLKRGHANLLGGRAIRYEIFPLVFPEVPDFSLDIALNQGLLPRHYSSRNPQKLIYSYIADYLKEEIYEEALTRNLPAFNRFLEIIGLMNGEMIHYKNIASDVGVSAPTIKEYFQILSDTLIGNYLPAFQKRLKRRALGSPKFYPFDVGIVTGLTRRKHVEKGTELFGKAFEHFMYTQLTAHASYSDLNYPLSYWRTASGFEVDFILGEHEVAIEIKSTENANNNHLKGLRAFKEECHCKRAILVSLDAQPRKTEDNLEIMPWKIFLQKLWGGEIIR